MLKSINWKLILKGFTWLSCLVGVVFLLSFISVEKNKLKCTKVEILIPGADNFIEREEIDGILKQESGILIGKNLSSINIHQIEKTLKSNPYIAFVKVFVDMEGVIKIEVKQRKPVLRVINGSGQDFYIDSDGLKMPVSSNFTANVLVATGNILEFFNGKVDTLSTRVAKDIYKTALYAKNDPVWDAQFEQIYVNEKSDIEIIPRVGNQRIILGNADSLEVKMKNLFAFYKQAMPKFGWNTYKSINLKFTNQIVCEKFDSLAVKSVPVLLTPDSVSVSNKVTDTLVNKIPKTENKKTTTVVETSKKSTTKTVTEAKQDQIKPIKKQENKEMIAAKSKVPTAEKDKKNGIKN
jgi:cell division protein FtsQ